MADALADALLLAEAMTLKSALAGSRTGVARRWRLPPRSGRAVRRRDLMADVAAGLGGRYVTGPDIGTSSQDMQASTT